jgi:hypothetical protein
LEPDLLPIGKAFGKLVATQYPTGMAEGRAQAEAPVAVAGGRPGRIDLLLVVDDQGWPLLVVVEVKNTDWDARAAHRLRPNLARHARQVRRYLDSLQPGLEMGELAGVQAALVYPRWPSIPGALSWSRACLGSRGSRCCSMRSRRVAAAMSPEAEIPSTSFHLTPNRPSP